jgi:seryl-tRNA synthetase
MLDPKYLRQEDLLDQTKTRLAKKNFDLDTDFLIKLESQRKTAQSHMQDLQAERNTESKKIGQAKAQGQDIAPLLKQVENLGDKLKQAEEAFQKIQTQWQTYILTIPNFLHPDVPQGKDEADNKILDTIGEPKQFNFKPKDHIELGELNHNMDFERASKLSGSRFVVLKNQLARLHRALSQFMLNTHIEEHGYQETYVPYLVKSDCFYGTGQLPKFAEDFFKLEGERDLSLISTAEIALTNLVREEILDAKTLPLKFTAHTPCFRSEAGSYGKDTRGMIRQHQFDKVELVQIVEASQSEQALENLTQHAEVILQKLGLAYRKVLLCSGDTGFSAHKTYDLEVWLPGQNAYREISSCSLMTDFQARRMQTRIKNPETKKTEFVHTINGSGLAVGRTLVAVMENYQQEDGSIEIPEVLKPYMGTLAN